MRFAAKTGMRAAAAVACIALMPLAGMAEGHAEQGYGAKGYVGGKGYVAPASQQHRVAAERPYVRGQSFGTFTTRLSSSRKWRVPGCPTGFNGMYRGDIYCVNGRPID
ncbi:MAG: hypothetical protein AB8B60_10665 [Sulfitobacter sp.]